MRLTTACPTLQDTLKSWPSLTIKLPFCVGLRVQTWTESPRFPSYCPNGCEPPGYTFKDTINVKRIKIPGTDLAWRAENIAKGQVSCVA